MLIWVFSSKINLKLKTHKTDFIFCVLRFSSPLPLFLSSCSSSYNRWHRFLRSLSPFKLDLSLSLHSLPFFKAITVAGQIRRHRFILFLSLKLDSCFHPLLLLHLPCSVHPIISGLTAFHHLCLLCYCHFFC